MSEALRLGYSGVPDWHSKRMLSRRLHQAVLIGSNAEQFQASSWGCHCIWGLDDSNPRWKGAKYFARPRVDCRGTGPIPICVLQSSSLRVRRDKHSQQWLWWLYQMVSIRRHSSYSSIGSPRTKLIFIINVANDKGKQSHRRKLRHYAKLASLTKARTLHLPITPCCNTLF